MHIVIKKRSVISLYVSLNSALTQDSNNLIVIKDTDDLSVFICPPKMMGFFSSKKLATKCINQNVSIVSTLKIQSRKMFFLHKMLFF